MNLVWKAVCMFWWTCVAFALFCVVINSAPVLELPFIKPYVSERGRDWVAPPHSWEK